MANIKEYKGEKILFTSGLYWWNGLMFKTEKRAKAAIDSTLNAKDKGLY